MEGSRCLPVEVVGGAGGPPLASGESGGEVDRTGSAAIGLMSVPVEFRAAGKCTGPGCDHQYP